MAKPQWLKRFTQENRPGAYLQVVEPGEVKAGDPVKIVNRPAHGVTIGQTFRAYMTEPQLLSELVKIDGLPSGLRKSLHRRYEREGFVHVRTESNPTNPAMAVVSRELDLTPDRHPPAR